VNVGTDAPSVFSCIRRSGYGIKPLKKGQIGGQPMKTPKEEINAFLGKDTEFEGKFSFTGAVRIDGAFSGEIESSGTLIVGETATVKSQIHVADMIISGEVNGDIVAENKIEISVPGKLFGNIQTPRLVIEEGVIFEGKCRMQELGKEKRKAPEPSLKEDESLSILK
jgi:cytoskeletal protein CcmA (bactofilin family)